MADFCQSCSVFYFGDDYRELAGATSPESWEKGLSRVVLCEGCGPIQVGPEGKCITHEDCGPIRKSLELPPIRS